MKIGVVGGGQLGRMLALAGHQLGFSFSFLDPSEASPSRTLGTHHQNPFSETSIRALLASSDYVTWEFENVPPEVLASLSSEAPLIRPSPHALEIAQDRLLEKDFFASLGAELPRYAAVQSLEQLSTALEEIGYPAILKTRRLGYDGKGQLIISSPSCLKDSALHRAASLLLSAPCIVEEMVAFDRELSSIGVRGADGSFEWYPLTINTHRKGILYRSTPLTSAEPLADSISLQARSLMMKAMETLSYVGVLAIEFFERDGTLLVNECAPRVHNSGHWTIEGAITSQFENHLRAVTGLPLGATSPRAAAIAMRNIIGTEPNIPELLALPGVHLHWYGKEVRPGRKVGHVTIIADSPAALASIEESPVFDTIFGR